VYPVVDGETQAIVAPIYFQYLEPKALGQGPILARLSVDRGVAAGGVRLRHAETARL